MIPIREFKKGDRVRIIKPKSVNIQPSPLVGKEVVIIRVDKKATDLWNSSYSYVCGERILYIVEGKDIDNTGMGSFIKFDNKNQIDVVDFCLELIAEVKSGLDCVCDRLELFWGGCKCGAFKREKEDI